MVVEDEPDLRLLIRIRFSLDPEFVVYGEATEIGQAVAAIEQFAPDLVVLDHHLGGDLSGLDGAEFLKRASPSTKIILFTATEEVRRLAADSPWIDAFLLKTDIARLVPLGRQLLQLD